MSQAKQIGRLVATIVEQLVVIKEKELLKPETLARLDVLANKVLDKLEPCLEKLDFCPEEKPIDNGNGGGTVEQPKRTTYIGFSLNIYTVVAWVTRFVVVVDGITYDVIAKEGEDGVALHNRMKDMLAGNTQGFELQKFFPNGSDTNFGYELKGGEDFLGKQVTVSIEGEGTNYGNITVQAEMLPALESDVMGEKGKATGVGYFEFPTP